MLARLSLRIKLFGLAAIALLTMAAVLTFVQDRLAGRTLEAQLEARATSARPILEAALIASMIERDYATIQAVLYESVMAGSFAHMVLVDARGQLIASEGWSFGDGMPQPGRFTMADGEQRMLYSLRISLAGQALGTLHFGLSRGPLQEAHQAMLIGGLVASLAALALLVPLVELGTWVILRPLRRLEAAAETIRDGSYDIALRPHGQDEVARLTTTFVEMADAMRERLRALIASEASQRVLLDNARLREIDLREARDKAEIGTRAKSEFLANMSHELRTPLNGILGMAQVLEASERNAEDQKAIAAILESGRQLLAMINDVLELSLFETGGGKLTLAPVQSQALFGKALVPAAAAAQRKGLEWHVHLADDLPRFVLADRTRMGQLLAHLADNAVKFTKSGAITIEATWRDEGPEGWLRVEIHDTGIGIPPEARPRLFERFSQAESSSTRSFGGSGLGLAICRNLTSLMGGHIGFVSEPGKGSIFWFELPLKVPTPG